jgi:hypothetical protein
MGSEWIGYHLASILTKFIGCTSNFECNWKDFANANKHLDYIKKL